MKPDETAKSAEELRARWDALKSDLGARIDADIAVAGSFAGTGTAAAHLALVSANRTTLAKMRELEGT